MARFTYIDFINALQDENTISVIGKIDTNFLDKQIFESLYYSFPLIERLVLEIYKTIPDADVEHYDQGIMKTLLSIIENNSNINILPERTIEILYDYYGDNGLRNELLHSKSEVINIKVSFDEINFIIMQLLSILKKLLNDNSNFDFKNIEYI